jgi:hypothetical protein
MFRIAHGWVVVNGKQERNIENTGTFEKLPC